MKTKISILLTIILFGTLVFVNAYNVGTSDIGKTIVLDEGTTNFNIGLSIENVAFGKSTNSVLNNNHYNPTIICKNGYIEKVIGSTTTNGLSTSENIYLKKISKLNLGIKTNGSWDNTTIVKCKSIIQPSNQFKAVDINYETINQKTVFGDSLSISKGKIDITETDVKDRLVASKEVDNQPSFTDILFLQLTVIGNLSDSILLENGDNFQFTGLFINETKYEEFSKWLDKFSIYSTKKEFQDAFSGAITMKDIGIAQDIILGLYKCVNEKQCSKVVNFKNPINKYDLYSLSYIENTLYSGDRSILKYSIDYFNGIKDRCSGEKITDDFLKNQVDNICSLIVKDNIDTINENTLYDLGYAVGKRVENLNNIKNNIGTGGLNLLGVYNIYWELNNLTLGTSKIEIVKKVSEYTDIYKEYEQIKDIFNKDIKELKNNKTDEVQIDKIIALKQDVFDISNQSRELLKNKNLLDLNKIDLISDSDGNKTIKIDDVIVTNITYTLVGQNDYNSHNLGLGIGDVMFNSVNSRCYPEVEEEDDDDKSYFKNENCDGNNNGEIGNLNFHFAGVSSSNVNVGTFVIGNYTGIFLDNDGTNDYLYYKNLYFGNDFKIELGVRGGALKRASGKYHILFRIPFTKKLHLEITDDGMLHAGYYNNDHHYNILNENISNKLDNDKFYKVIFLVNGNNWTITISDYNDNIVYTKSGTSNDTFNIQGNYIYIGGKGWGQWNDLIDYIKIYKADNN